MYADTSERPEQLGQSRAREGNASWGRECRGGRFVENLAEMVGKILGGVCLILSYTYRMLQCRAVQYILGHACGIRTVPVVL
jgi:hypothetical protein